MERLVKNHAQLRDRLMYVSLVCEQRGISWKEFKAGILPPKTTWKTLTEEQIQKLEEKLSSHPLAMGHNI